MKKNFSVLFLLSAVLVIIISCNNESENKQPTGISKDSLIKRGDYLVTIMGCEDCHSPKIMGPQGPEYDPQNRLAGHLANSTLPPVSAAAGKDGWVLFTMDQTATVGPWGTSYAANISSDTTGIGVWTEQQFATAMRKGKSKGLEGARTLLPPMPWPNYARLSDTDLAAIFAYLKSSKAVKNVVPASKSPEVVKM